MAHDVIIFRIEIGVVSNVFEDMSQLRQSVLETNSLCVQRDLLYDDFGSQPILRVQSKTFQRWRDYVRHYEITFDTV
jgi:hypothetical protein